MIALSTTPRPRAGCVAEPQPASTSPASPSAAAASAGRVIDPETGTAETVEECSIMPGVIMFAALSGPLPKAGVIAAAGFIALALLHPQRAGQAAGVAGGLILALVLLLAEIWHSPQLGLVHRHPLAAAAIGAGALVVVVLLAVAIALRPHLLAVLVVVTLPFRIPIEAGGTTTNL